MNTWREFRFLRKGKASLIWMIKQDGESYFTRHGQLDGALQEFSDTPGPKGKEDTKAYVNAFKNCDFHVGREIRKKIEAGYIAYVNDEPTKEQITELYFDRYLPKQFCGYKPQTSITDKVHYKIYKEGNARYTRKLDGMCSLAVYHTWGWEIYSRRMDLLTDRFHNHIEYLSELDCFKHGTMLVGEMICLKSDGKDDFKAVSRVCRSKAPDARKLVEDGEVPEPVFVVF
ncbi:MAG: hypothetical protein H8E55_08415, partial [Pelagibacterales bacterium]|nr:hypothetical protein [Pelagibacterales bacterium]